MGHETADPARLVAAGSRAAAATPPIGAHLIRPVVHLLGSAGAEATGIARLVAVLARRAAPERYPASALFLGGPGPLTAMLHAAGVPAAALTWRGSRDLAGARAVWRAFRAMPGAMVHQHFGGVPIRALARVAGLGPIVVHAHGLDTEGPRPRRLVQSMRFADAAIAVSSFIAGKITDREAAVVWNCADVPARAVDPAVAAPIVGVAARLAPVKGLDLLLAAWPAVRARMPGARLEIAGDGPLRGALEAQAAVLGIADSVAFLGWQADLAPLFARWRLLAQPSRAEGFGLSLVEAMAAGLPAVATAVGGVPDVIDDRTTGTLVPPEDASALGAAIAALLADPARCAAMGAAGRARVVERFSPEAMARGVVAVYDRVTGSPRS